MAGQSIYFHGIPGGPGELTLFGEGLDTGHGDVHVVDRSNAKDWADADRYLQHLADAIRTQFPDQPLRLIGFSLGASAALRTAPYLGLQVTGIDLISAAAPLTLGDYLGGMAGAPVFKLARSWPTLFAGIVRLQSIAARLASGKLYDALFASAQGADLALSKDPAFKAAMLSILQHSLGAGLSTYRREIALYVEDWEDELGRVTPPVTLYHGTADNWSPVAMAQDLAGRLPNVAAVHLLDDLAHYSTLREYWRLYFTQPSPIVS
ncbi:alpha/beta hydrolase [Blastomonas sp.]|uniref:alpha/beta fold hydrolase n=1 Tax=Blastomonas sp. TaxID=1909299 RepID=UPI0026311700|nr:alpha/beta hydrolase [Blastomonas sp.]MDM7956310.1 alpha/beta hydrolase [Blastomonas sp.]